MKFLALMILSFMFMSCSSQHRKVSSEERLTQQERMEQLSEFGSGYRR